MLLWASFAGSVAIGSPAPPTGGLLFRKAGSHKEVKIAL